MCNLICNTRLREEKLIRLCPIAEGTDPGPEQVPPTERGAVPDGSEAGLNLLMDSLNRHWSREGRPNDKKQCGLSFPLEIILESADCHCLVVCRRSHMQIESWCILMPPVQVCSGSVGAFFAKLPVQQSYASIQA